MLTFILKKEWFEIDRKIKRKIKKLTEKIKKVISVYRNRRHRGQ